MNESMEQIERYLRGMTPPHCVSEEHRQQLRRQVLGQLQPPRTIPLPGLRWKIAAAALVGLAGVAGALLEARHHTAGPNTGGVYQLISENRQNTPEPGTTTKAFAEKDPNGLELLPPQDNLKLISVVESEVNGRLDSRTLLCKYARPEERPQSTGDPNRAGENPLASLPPAVSTEIGQLRRAGQGENLGAQVKEIKGRPFVFQRERFTLHNGTKVVVSVGAPQEMAPATQQTPASRQ